MPTSRTAMMGLVSLLAAGISAIGGAALLSQAPQARAVDRAVPIPSGVVLLEEDGGRSDGHPVSVASFRIDPHEVTNRQFAEFVAATRYDTQAEREGAAPVFVMPRVPVALDDPSRWWVMTDGANWRHPTGPRSSISGHMDDPVVQVSYDDASAYARWVGGRLPTAAEWERAARADQTGPRDALSWVRDAAGRPLANHWQGVFPIRDTGDDGHVGIAPVESYRPNGFGLYDMVGNVWEWTSQEAGDGRRVVKGGSYLYAANYCANYRPAAWQAQEHDLGASHIGFRVVTPL